ncbi:MAG: hypothetical protein UHD09_09430 [Bifidobacterium sp.]|nr:hypothetical protein [Bifidobacterium sp.]
MTTPNTASAAELTITDDWLQTKPMPEYSTDGKTWTAYTTGTDLDYGTQLRMQMSFEVPNASNVQTGDTFVYSPLPTGLTYETDRSYTMTNAAGDVLGSYTIKDGKLTITYTGPSNPATITGSVIVEGTFDEAALGGNNGGDRTFNFLGADEFTVTVNPNTELRVTKNGAITVPEDSNLFDFVITVESIGPNKQIVLDDTMGDLLTLYDGNTFHGSWIQVYTDETCNTPVPASEWSVTKDSAANGFHLTIDSMSDHQTYYVKYRVKLTDRKAAIQLCKNWACSWDGSPAGQRVGNTVTYESAGDKNNTPITKGVWLMDLWGIEKNGWETTITQETKDGEETTVTTVPGITWTVTITPKEDADLTGVTVRDELDPNLETPISAPTLQCYTDVWNSQPIDCGTVSWEQLANGTMTLPKNENQNYAKYVISYATSFLRHIIRRW